MRILDLLSRLQGTLDSTRTLPATLLALILKQVARSLDDAAKMFIRQFQKMHNRASDALVLYRAAHAERTDAFADLTHTFFKWKPFGKRRLRKKPSPREVARREKATDICGMMDYQHVGVASTFSPSFTGVLAEAKRFASHCGADLEIMHAGVFDIEKEKRFLGALGQWAEIRWVEGETAASAIIAAAENFAYDLFIAGTPHRGMDDKPFAGDVAPELLRNAPCDLLLVPRPLEDPPPPQHIVFALEPEPEEENCELLRRVVEVLRPGRVTIAVTDRPFAPAIAASRGEQPGDVEAWLEDLTGSLAAYDVEVEGRVVTSITGYTLYDTIEGLEADLLVVKAEPDGSLPKHMDWLYQVIPTRLLLVRGG